MQYWHSIKDKHGYTHSIDMVIVDYMLTCKYQTFEKKLLEILSGHDVKSSLGNVPNFKYQYYVDMIWCEGFVFYLGKYSVQFVSSDQKEKKWVEIDSLRIRVNPNKRAHTELMQKVLDLVKEYCVEGSLVRYDYAIDIPVPIDDILVINSRKEKGLYRGTRYFGRRHQHGYLKIYDKAKEQKESEELTRLEYTYKHGEIPSWDNIVVRNVSVARDGVFKLPKQSMLYLDMLLEIKALGGQIEPYLERLNYRTMKQIEPYLFSGVQLDLENEIIDSLVSNICDSFIITDNDDNVNSDDDFVQAGWCPWEDNE